MKFPTALLSTLLVVSGSAIDVNRLRGAAVVPDRIKKKVEAAVATPSLEKKRQDGEYRPLIAANDRRLNPVSIIVTIAGMVVTGAGIGIDLMPLSDDKPLKSLVVNIASTETSFDLDVAGGAVNHDSTIVMKGRGKGVVEGEIIDCWEYNLQLVIEEPVWNPDCHHYTGFVKHICDPHEGDNRNGGTVRVNERLCTDSTAGKGGVTSWPAGGGDTWFHKNIAKDSASHPGIPHNDAITGGALQIQVDWDWANEIVAHNFDMNVKHEGDETSTSSTSTTSTTTTTSGSTSTYTSTSTSTSTSTYPTRTEYSTIYSTTEYSTTEASPSKATGDIFH